MLHLEAIEPATLELLKRLQALPVFAETRLVGGTALALQLGHRVSVDLDVFGKWDYAADPALAMRSMSYFVDAETMPMPRMLVPFPRRLLKHPQVTPPFPGFHSLQTVAVRIVL